MTVAVVILNYNGKKYLESFLPIVLKHSEQATVWVVDNCSTDDSVAYLSSTFPTVQVLINESNGGFAKGYNDGLSQIKADYYVLLNSDVEVSPNWLAPCLNLLESDPQIAAVQPKILAYKNKTHFEHAGAAGGFLDSNFYPFCRGRIFDLTEDDQGQYNDTKEIFWATGACMFVRADLYHQLGGLDADFFAHMEEIDFCWRVKKLGYKIYYCGESSIYHVGGGTLDYGTPRKTYLNFRNSLYMIYKNYEGFVFGKLLNRLLLDGIAGAMFLSKLQFKHFWVLFKSHIVFYANLKTLHRKRIAIKKMQGDSKFNSTGLYNKNIAFKRFISGLKKFSELQSSDFD